MMETDEHSLARLRGQRMNFRMAGLAEVPRSISTIEDGCLHQHALEAWTAASRLAAALDYLELFKIASSLKVSISDEDQQTITDGFPILLTMQMVLDHLAPLPERTLEGQPFPAPQLTDLVLNALGIIQKLTSTLIAMDVKSTVFSPDSPIDWKLSGAIEVDVTQPLPIVKLPDLFPPQFRSLKSAARHLLDLLENAPSTALNFPKQFGGSNF